MKELVKLNNYQYLNAIYTCGIVNIDDTNFVNDANYYRFIYNYNVKINLQKIQRLL